MLMCDFKQAFHSWKPSSVVDLKKKKKKNSAKVSRPKFLHSDLKDIASNHTHLIAVRAAKSGKTSY